MCPGDQHIRICVCDQHMRSCDRLVFFFKIVRPIVCCVALDQHICPCDQRSRRATWTDFSFLFVRPVCWSQQVPVRHLLVPRFVMSHTTYTSVRPKKPCSGFSDLLICVRVTHICVPPTCVRSSHMCVSHICVFPRSILVCSFLTDSYLARIIVVRPVFRSSKLFVPRLLCRSVPMCTHSGLLDLTFVRSRPPHGAHRTPSLFATLTNWCSPPPSSQFRAQQVGPFTVRPGGGARGGGCTPSSETCCTSFEVPRGLAKGFIFGF